MTTTATPVTANYQEVTQGFQVSVEPLYVPERSRPEAGYFFFAYRVKIRNLGDKPARLVSRHWLITDGHGRLEEVQGPGVVGEQPRIEPGGEHEYASYCPLPTPTGNMRGTYEMMLDSGETFRVKIPLFFLRDLRTLH